jgi:Ca2+-transporting ATPase
MNIVTDTFPALALSVEPGDGDVMKRPPRHPEEAVLSAEFVLQIVLYAALIAGASLAAFRWALSYDVRDARTVAFMTLSLAQILHLGNARSAEAVLSPRRAFANRMAVAAVLLSIALQTLGTENRWIAGPLHVTPLDVREWLIVAACSAVPAVVGQAVKLVRSVRRGPRAPHPGGGGASGAAGR